MENIILTDILFDRKLILYQVELSRIFTDIPEYSAAFLLANPVCESSANIPNRRMLLVCLVETRCRLLGLKACVTCSQTKLTNVEAGVDGMSEEILRWFRAKGRGFVCPARPSDANPRGLSAVRLFRCA
jgi:hypothetical protein